MSKYAAKKQEESDAPRSSSTWSLTRGRRAHRRLQLLMARKEAVDDEKTAIMQAWRKFSRRAAGSGSTTSPENRSSRCRTRPSSGRLRRKIFKKRTNSRATTAGRGHLHGTGAKVYDGRAFRTLCPNERRRHPRVNERPRSAADPCRDAPFCRQQPRFPLSLPSPAGCATRRACLRTSGAARPALRPCRELEGAIGLHKCRPQVPRILPPLGSGRSKSAITFDE